MRYWVKTIIINLEVSLEREAYENNCRTRFI